MIPNCIAGYDREPFEDLIKDYKARHLAVTSKLVEDAKYVTTYESVRHSGLGNTLPGLVSAFFLALALNRTLLLDTPVMLQQLDTGPLDFSYANQVSFLAPKTIETCSRIVRNDIRRYLYLPSGVAALPPKLWYCLLSAVLVDLYVLQLHHICLGSRRLLYLHCAFYG